MTEPAASALPSVYQLRVVLRGLSPLVWRRLIVGGDSTIADLHEVLQASFGWSDDHLHRFEIHGRECGISYLGGIGFQDDARTVRLESLGLRVGKRFVYEYDFSDAWFHDLGWSGSPPPSRDRPARAASVAGGRVRRRTAGDPGPSRSGAGTTTATR